MTHFAHEVPTWKLPAEGGVAALLGLNGGGSAFEDPSF